ncbi:MAG TPA: DNA repair protein RadC [Bacteroidia bacterium]|nr:DNA repair protein RadC [Bacteroidia bacterium]
MEVKGIKSWAEDDRPREKLMLKGRSALSDAELIAILIGSGNNEETAVEVARKILGDVNMNLVELGKLSVNDLMKHKGIGEAKAIAIVAAMELGNRRRESETLQREKIITSKDAFEIFSRELADKPNEEFWILMLNRANKIIGRHRVSEGGVAGTVVDAKKVFKPAVENFASSIILGHNHPSGNIQPSNEDISLTKKLAQAGSNLDVKVLDHIIITDSGYFSFADEGMM